VLRWGFKWALLRHAQVVRGEKWTYFWSQAPANREQAPLNKMGMQKGDQIFSQMLGTSNVYHSRAEQHEMC